MTKIIRGAGQDGLNNVFRWIQSEVVSGARLFVVEGLPGAGKTTLAKSAPTGLLAIDLDEFLNGPVLETVPWLDRVVEQGAVLKLSEHFASKSPLVVCGVQAAGVVAACSNKPQRKDIRLVYIKEMAMRGDQWYWTGQLDIDANYEIHAFLGSARNYHRRQRPWLKADLVFERLSD